MANEHDWKSFHITDLQRICIQAALEQKTEQFEHLLIAGDVPTLWGAIKVLEEVLYGCMQEIESAEHRLETARLEYKRTLVLQNRLHRIATAKSWKPREVWKEDE